MGDERLSAEALRQSNNDIDMAIEAIQSSPESLIQNITEKGELDSHMTEEMISTVVKMGFSDKEEVKKAMKEAKGNLENAVSILTSQKLSEGDDASLAARAENAARKMKEKIKERKSR